METEIVSKMKSNGISFNLFSKTPESQRDEMSKCYNTVTTSISLFKMRHTESEIIDTIRKKYDESDLFPGIRFKDNLLVSGRVMTAIASYYYNENTPNSKSDGEIAKNVIDFVRNINASSLDILILDALRDSASSDYYYKFEKEWS
jgi:hypothetical protein